MQISVPQFGEWAGKAQAGGPKSYTSVFQQKKAARQNAQAGIEEDKPELPTPPPPEVSLQIHLFLQLIFVSFPYSGYL